ncbi:hypothetical protein [Pseudomonas putida]|uniref:hypothetical protein n=1 Tax=Pseudomonas putida TaxID=303 RepID=UPI00382CC9E7
MPSTIARVRINGVEVGSLPTETYNNIVASARAEPGMYMAYLLAWIVYVVRLILSAAIVSPTILLAIFGLVALLEPSVIADLIILLRSASPDELSVLVYKLTGYIACGFIGVPMIMATIFPGVITFKSPIRAWVEHDIRDLLEVPTKGHLSVRIVENPSAATTRGLG